MLFTTLLPLTLLTSILASPVPTTETTPSPTTTCSTLTTKQDYYQGYQSPSQCGINVASGNITSGTCVTITTQGIMLFPADTKCTYSLWKGVTDCSGQVTETFDLGVKTEGVESQGVCVGTGVMDGGKWYHGSGFLSCGC
ncbi:hypothetical protein SS1G_04857 [Sclerotinia sclerotiorum 1980 UF-70]|uniref:Uncharacterized protein n=2 Tax=Sclerotinia sclerotiorum (strain ATCC 18683 / 1980 / Ss-1) TaxID=665079 RepID=A7EHR5_SCLS1|nr:hypothetical protein SS1G_04857 [Sclerotinia sclerotiorum 1980 UF-70]APA11459.1 hypothetical protein sscle_08g062290 [Sclerotinia sclerotiorum 1980 UF-70]EDO02381.1 hypothetical protein SS1G_04857 [Sclerotinia sclerotiorum 1980 UF-70]